METLIEVHGRMNAGQYCQILEDRMEESFEKLEMEEDEHYFQQDNCYIFTLLYFHSTFSPL